MPVVMWTRPFQENCSLSYCKGYATSTFSIFSMFMIIHDYSISLYIILLFRWLTPMLNSLKGAPETGNVR